MKEIYLDASTMAPPSEKAVAEMLPYLTEKWGALSQPHKKGQQLFHPLKEATALILKLVGGKQKDKIVFTSSGAEAVWQVFFSVYFGVCLPSGKNHMLTLEIDEAPFYAAQETMEKLGTVVKKLRPNSYGELDEEIVAKEITPRTALISLSFGNGLTGVVQPIQEIAALCQERGILLHLDVSHTLFKYASDLACADYITWSGELMSAPAGSGALLARELAPLFPLIAGGLEQGGYRAGHVPAPFVVAHAQALKEASELTDYMATEIARLRYLLEVKLVSALSGIRPLFQDQERVPHISCLQFEGVVSEALLYALSKRGVFASRGGGSFQELGRVLSLCGFDALKSHSALTFSLSSRTTEEEILRAVAIIVEEVKALRSLAEGLL